jgi:hypothetical protein
VIEQKHAGQEIKRNSVHPLQRILSNTCKNAHWAYWPTDAQLFWQGCRPVDRKRCDTPKWDNLTMDNGPFKQLYWLYSSILGLPKGLHVSPSYLPSLGISSWERARPSSKFTSRSDQFFMLTLGWTSTTRCSPRYRMHSRKTLSWNGLFEQSCICFPCYRTSALQTVACRKGVECKVWRGVECRV